MAVLWVSLSGAVRCGDYSVLGAWRGLAVVAVVEVGVVMVAAGALWVLVNEPSWSAVAQLGSAPLMCVSDPAGSSGPLVLKHFFSWSHCQAPGASSHTAEPETAVAGTIAHRHLSLSPLEARLARRV